MRCAASRLLVASLALLVADVERASAQGSDPFEPRLRRFLDEHCVACHGPEVQKRRLRLDQLPSAFGDTDIAATWVKGLDKVSSGVMPPKGEPRPEAAEAPPVSAGVDPPIH